MSLNRLNAISAALSRKTGSGQAGIVRGTGLETTHPDVYPLKMAKNSFRYFKTSPEIIQLGVLMYVRFPLSLRNVEDLLHERGIDICHEIIRLWVDRLGTYFALKIPEPHSEDGRAKYPASRGRQVCRSSSQSIRQCTITSTSKGTSTPESNSNKKETPRFASGATFSSPSTCSSANNGDWFALD